MPIFSYMKLTLQVQLLPDRGQDDKLQATVKRFNEAACWLAKKAFELRLANKVELQKLFYAAIRTQFDLSSQMTVRCIAQVVEAYKRDKSKCPAFRPFAAMPYDQRIMRFKGLDRVSLLTLDGRVIVPVIMGQYQRVRFTPAIGQFDLVRRKDGKWFLLVVADVPDGTPIPTTDFIGVDLGIKSIATLSTGKDFGGSALTAYRLKRHKVRKSLQSKAHKEKPSTRKNARRVLRRTGSKEQRFQKWINHNISKQIVETAKGTGRGIALEDLKGIRTRTTVRKSQRGLHNAWAFSQLRLFVEYKALRAGVPAVSVDPRYTSQTCSSCRHLGRRRGKIFSCSNCGAVLDADLNGAKNIAAVGGSVSDPENSIPYAATIAAAD